MRGFARDLLTPVRSVDACLLRDTPSHLSGGLDSLPYSVIQTL